MQIDLPKATVFVDDKENISVDGTITIDDVPMILASMGKELVIIPCDDEIERLALAIAKVRDKLSKHGFDHRDSQTIAVQYLCG